MTPIDFIAALILVIALWGAGMLFTLLTAGLFYLMVWTLVGMSAVAGWLRRGR
jgi:hypothetical protein